MATNVLEPPIQIAEVSAEEARRAKEMRQLAAAAYQPPEKAGLAFLRVLSQVDLETHPAEDFARAVHLALAAGAYLAARELAADGAAKYPEHAELRKMAWVLAPPRVIGFEPHDPTRAASLEANRAWFKEHATSYRGQWVAVRNGQLLGAALTLRELREQIGGDLKIATIDKIR